MAHSTPGFRLIKTAWIHEINARASLYEHEKTRAHLLSVHTTDENKAFGITFRTPPPDSSGIAHIMEHSVLCGSKNYPLKEPFIELVKGSLHTFLNAFTYPDKTSYPVASTNEKDFYNLTRVYLDAVFFPILSKETLMQEGWHLHQEKATDEPSIRGVVYNEMKGAYNSPDRALWDTIQASLLSDTPYRYDSGGDPLMIPTLTYESFLRFHTTYYHPSNALLFFAGDDALEKRLALAGEYLDQFEYQEVPWKIPLQPAFNKPRHVRATVPIGPNDDPKKKGMAAVAWVLTEPTKLDLALRLRILSHILVGTSASPLRKALSDSGIGEDIAGDGVESDLQQMIFAIGLRGIDTERAHEVHELVTQTLQSLATKGIAQDIIDSAMSSTEFHLREQNTGAFPRGLALLYGILPSWLYGGDPIEAMQFERLLADVRDEISSGSRPFERLITQFFLTNTHRVSVTLEPSAQEQARREAVEKTMIRTKLQALSAQARQSLPQETSALVALQETSDTPAMLEKLPKLGIADLEKQNVPIPRVDTSIHAVPVYTHPLETNGVVYVDLAFDLLGVPERLLTLLPLFARCLTEMGTASATFDQCIHRMHTHTGGITTQLFTSTAYNSTDPVIRLLIRGKWLESKGTEAIRILQDFLLHGNLTNKERFYQMLVEEKSAMELEIIESGHQYADSRIRAQFRGEDWFDEQCSGITQLMFLRELSAAFASRWEQLSADLEQLRTLILHRAGLVVGVTASGSLLANTTALLEDLLSSLPKGSSSTQSWSFQPTHQHELLIAPTSVNYVGKGINLYDEGYVFDGSAQVITKYLRASWLWEQVRMKGGAYGAFSVFHPLSGTFTLLSYRDPHTQETLDTFDKTAQFLANLELSDDELTKAIIGTISDVDHYLLPDAKGLTSLTRVLTGVSDARRQQTREEILSTTKDDFRAFARQLEILAQKGSVCIVSASADGMEKAKQILV